MRLIDADALHARFKEIQFSDLNGDELRMVMRIHDMFDNAPTIDAEPVQHGRWENAKAAFHKKCSHCKCILHMPRERNYCPNCGAKMDLKEYE